MVHSSELFFRQRENVVGWKHSQVQAGSEFHTGASSRKVCLVGDDVSCTLRMSKCLPNGRKQGGTTEHMLRPY